MVTYETGLMVGLISLPFFSMLMAYFMERKSTTLQTFFVILSMFFMVGVVGVGLEIVDVNNGDNSLDGVVNMVSQVYQGWLVCTVLIFIYVSICYFINSINKLLHVTDEKGPKGTPFSFRGLER